MHLFRFVGGCALTVALLPSGHVRSADAGLGPHLKPCVQGKSKTPALCGTFGVYENRDSRSGRIIALRIIVLEARHATHRAMAVIGGGPGEGVTDEAVPIADGFDNAIKSVRDSYDILFMDDRGTGGSNQLQCDLVPQSDPAAYFKQLFPDKLLIPCQAKFGAANDLSKYNTNYSVDDLDDVRAGLGYPKLVLNGGSYGTTFSLVYMRRHPVHVESAILDGVAPPHFFPLPGEPVGLQTALDDLVTKCKHDAGCTKNFPHFAENFAALLTRLSGGPIPVTLKRKGQKDVEVQLSKEVFVDHLRQVLYAPEGASLVPLVIERASKGDTAPLATVLNFVAVGLAHDLAMGAWLSYTCADEIPFLDEALVKVAAAHSFAGDLRIEAQRHACAIWRVPTVPAKFNDPVRSDAPVLIISGSDDPATPPRYAQQAAVYLPNAKIVLVRGAGHGADTPCTDRLKVQFVRARSAKALDTTKCSASFSLPHFATSLPSFL